MNLSRSFEAGVISDNAGRLWWIVVVFASVVYYSLRWKSYIFPSPGAHLVRYFNGGCHFRELVLRSVAVMASGKEHFQSIFAQVNSDTCFQLQDFTPSS